MSLLAEVAVASDNEKVFFLREKRGEGKKAVVEKRATLTY